MSKMTKNRVIHARTVQERIVERQDDQAADEDSDKRKTDVLLRPAVDASKDKRKALEPAV